MDRNGRFWDKVGIPKEICIISTFVTPFQCCKSISIDGSVNCFMKIYLVG